MGTNDPQVKAEQSRRAREEFQNSIRITKAANGFILKKPEGQFVYGDSRSCLKAVEEFLTADEK